MRLETRDFSFSPSLIFFPPIQIVCVSNTLNYWVQKTTFNKNSVNIGKYIVFCSSVSWNVNVVKPNIVQYFILIWNIDCDSHFIICIFIYFHENIIIFYLSITVLFYLLNIFMEKQCSNLFSIHKYPCKWVALIFIKKKYTTIQHRKTSWMVL